MSAQAGRAAGRSWKNIYALLDPRDSPPSVRYVGCTSSSVDTRFSMHISTAVRGESETPKDMWIREVVSENHLPLFMLLERVDDGGDWEAREKYWIEKYAGPALTNVARGGKGSPGAKRTEARFAEVGDFFRGRPLSEEHKAKISKAKMGHEVPPEVREAISEKLQGRVLSEDHRRAISQGNLGKKHTAESRQRISETRRQRIADGTIKAPAGGAAKAAELLKGSVWITNGTGAQRLPKGQPVPEGWRLGRK